jgi:N-acetylmuramoyl-L-alanine amidase
MLLRQELDVAKTGATARLLLERVRVLVGSYEDLARLFGSSSTADDALSHGGLLAADAFARFGEATDRDTAVRLLKSLSTRFPSSPLARQSSARLNTLEKEPPATAPSAAGAAPPVATTPSPVAAPAPNPVARPAQPPAAATASGPVTLRAIRRDVLADVLRVTLELDREVSFYDERIDGPPRVYVDLHNTRAADSLKDATIPFPEGPVKQVRVGRQLNLRTRVVLDLNGAGAHSVYAVYDPYRIVIDLERGAPAASSGVVPSHTAAVDAQPTRAPAVMAAAASRTPRTSPGAPATPPPNRDGSFSLARQLGLGITRVVIDPGHGGHDPGARGNGISEAALVLDVASRLEQLLKEQNVDVVLTRRTDTYVSLEERTALANTSEADVFLSIHANASPVASARGIETYYLNFASTADAEAIAARENAGSARSMRHLPDIVQAIALNNKLDESRDFATIVQSTLYEQLRKSNKTLKNLGVKQAPFMVLIGARMPSVLAEISFMSNRTEATLLKTDRYKQQIAEALLAGIMRYQSSLKKGTSRAE